MKPIFFLFFLITFCVCKAEEKPNIITDDKGQTFFAGPYRVLKESDKITFKTKGGIVYKNAFICGLQTDGVVVAHGLSKVSVFFENYIPVKFEDLPESLQKKYDYRKKDLLKKYLNGEEKGIEVIDDGFRIFFDDGAITLSNEQLTKAMRDKFHSQSSKLLKRLAQGIDGYYGLNPKIGYYAGSTIEIRNDKYTYFYFSDFFDPSKPTTPLSGNYILENGWLHLDQPELKNWSDYAFAMVNGQLVLMNFHHYPRWKKTRELPDDVLYWNRLK